ncbi:MAG: ATP-binding protein [Roseivirga sp.]
MAVIGPESTGKSTLASALADYFGTRCVPEYAREFLGKLDRPYNQDDLLTIAKGQLEDEKAFRKQANDLIILDTDLFVIKVWSEFKYGNADPFLLQLLSMNQADLYLLTSPDIPFEDDPLRESPKDRARLFDIYHKELMNAGVNFQIVDGSHESRLQKSIMVINDLI